MRINLVAEQVTIVYVKANTGAQFRGQDLLFNHGEEFTLPEGVTIEESFITVPNDRLKYVPIPTANTNRQYITLNQCTVLDHLQIIKTNYAYYVRTEQVNVSEGEHCKETEWQSKNREEQSSKGWQAMNNETNAAESPSQPQSPN